MIFMTIRRYVSVTSLVVMLLLSIGGAQGVDLRDESSPASVGQKATADEVEQTRQAPVNSKALLDAYLEKPVKDNPLTYLSEAARRRFVASLTFNENGLTGFRYDDLEAELTVTQAYEVLRLFGAQSKLTALDLAASSRQDAELFDVLEKSPPSLAQDYKEYKCIGRATCRLAEFHICMRGCASIP